MKSHELAVELHRETFYPRVWMLFDFIIIQTSMHHSDINISLLIIDNTYLNLNFFKGYDQSFVIEVNL